MTYTLTVNVQMRDEYGRDSLQVSETCQVEASSFLEIAKVLGQFHDLAESMKSQPALDLRR